jgi:hypothetical protein
MGIWGSSPLVRGFTQFVNKRNPYSDWVVTDVYSTELGIWPSVFKTSEFRGVWTPKPPPWVRQWSLGKEVKKRVISTERVCSAKAIIQTRNWGVVLQWNLGSVNVWHCALPSMNPACRSLSTQSPVVTVSTTGLTLRNSTFCPVNLCVLCRSENRQRLFPSTALTYWFFKQTECLLRGTSWVFKCNSGQFSSLYC